MISSFFAELDPGVSGVQDTSQSPSVLKSTTKVKLLSVNGATSWFADFEKLVSLIVSSSSFVIRVNLLHP